MSFQNKQPRRNSSGRKVNAISDPINAPMVEIFGGAFALLLILFVLINVIANTEIYAMLESTTDEGTYKVSWENEAEGFVIMVFPDRLHILETNTSIERVHICNPNGDFLQYAANIYLSAEVEQIIFAIVEGAVGTMALARNCLYSAFRNRRIGIGWIIANDDLLNAVNLQDIPSEIKRAVSGSIQK